MRFDSLQSRIALAISGIVFLLMTFIVIFFSIEAKRELSEAFEKNALNLLTATRNQVESHYNSIQYYRTAMTERRKRELKNNTDIAFSVIETAQKLHAEAGMTEARAQQMTLKKIKEMRFDDGVGYFWMNDTTRPIPRIIMHPVNPELIGKSSDGPRYHCLLNDRGERIEGNLFSAFLKTALDHGEGYVNYLWPKPTPAGLTEDQPKIGFVKIFRPWNWIIGTGVYVDDIQRDIEQRTEAVVRDLNKLIPKQKIGESGYFFIFNDAGELIVHPLYGPRESPGLINPESGNNILDDLAAAEKTPEKALSYFWDKPDDKGNFVYRKKSYVTYFEPLGWYICSSVYLDDYEHKINAMNTKLALLGGGFILCALVIAFLMARNVTRPLKGLVETIQLTDEDGLPTQTIKPGGVAELKLLSATINRMISSIKRSRNRLKESESFNKVLFKDSRIPLVVMDSRTYRYIDCNQAAADIYGSGSIENTIGRTPMEFFAKTQYNGEDSRIAGERMLKEAKGKGAVTFEWRHQRANGEFWDAEVQLMKFHYMGKDLYQFSLQDVTERKKALEELNHIRKMDAIGQLAGGVAHDFNNMLSAIISSAELLKKPVRGLDEKGLKYTDLIIRASSQAAELTAKLLAFGRKGMVASGTVDVIEIIRDSVTILTKTSNKKVTITTAFEIDQAMVEGDSSGLQNAFINLGINASHAMPDGGELHFGVRLVDLGAVYCEASPFQLVPGGYVEIEVRDTGCGISEKDLPFIFEPFFTTRKRGQGSGLGLAAVYGTVQDHHGAIQVYSEVDRGTVFTLYLPLSQKTGREVVVKLKETQERLRGSGRILLIDDEDIIRISSASMLEELGYEVITANDGEDGVDIYRSRGAEIDLVITDMLMPKMNGREVFYQLKKINPDCRVVLASGFTDDQNVETLNRDGLQGFLKKPYRLESMGNLLHEILKS